jgi:hypothetical protein
MSSRHRDPGTARRAKTPRFGQLLFAECIAITFGEGQVGRERCVIAETLDTGSLPVRLDSEAGRRILSVGRDSRRKMSFETLPAFANRLGRCSIKPGGCHGKPFVSGLLETGGRDRLGRRSDLSWSTSVPGCHASSERVCRREFETKANRNRFARHRALKPFWRPGASIQSTHEPVIVHWGDWRILLGAGQLDEPLVRRSGQIVMTGFPGRPTLYQNKPDATEIGDG